LQQHGALIIIASFITSPLTFKPTRFASKSIICHGPTAPAIETAPAFKLDSITEGI
jgi:hypothetical protein